MRYERRRAAMKEVDGDERRGVIKFPKKWDRFAGF
jgi:hypothetical protein